MTRLFPALLLTICLTACASPALTIPLLLVACAPSIALPPPVKCEVDDLPPGVLAEADIETQTVTLSPAYLEAPDAVQWVVLAHEVCHLHGYTTEAGADCCSADAVGRMWGPTVVLEAAAWLQAHGRDVMMLVECVP